MSAKYADVVSEAKVADYFRANASWRVREASDSSGRSNRGGMIMKTIAVGMSGRRRLALVALPAWPMESPTRRR